MKKNKITILSLILDISLTLSSCSLFSDRSNGPDNKGTVANEEENNKGTNLKNGKEINNEDKDPSDQPQDPDDKIEAEEKEKAEEEKKKAEEEKKKAEEEKKKAEKEKKKAEKEKKKAEKEKKNKKENKPAANKNISLNKVKVGQLISINRNVNVYTNASDANSKKNSTKTYPAGQYYIYKIHNGMVNISLNKNAAGGWINPGDVNLSVASSKTGTPSNNNQAKKPYNNTPVKPGAKYSWSWLYPGNAGKALTKYGGVYRLSSGKNIYLTFDNGYEYKKNTSKILDSLSRTGVKAVFFTTSPFMKENPALVRRMVREGHVVGNHTQKHLNHNVSSASAIRADLVNWEKDYVRIVGAKPSVKLFRPPEGKFNETSLSIAQSLGYKTVLWGFAYGDWDTNNQPNRSTALNKLLSNNRPGNVLLLHSVSDTNVAILESYIKQTRSQGYNFVRLR